MRKPPRPVSRHHVHVYTDDWNFLNGIFGPGSYQSVTTSEVIREMIHKGTKMLRLKLIEKQEAAQRQTQGQGQPSRPNQPSQPVGPGRPGSTPDAQ